MSDIILQYQPFFLPSLIGVIALLVIVWFLRSPAAKKSQNDNLINLPSLQDTPMDFVGCVNKGNEYLTNYQTDEALSYFQAALKLRPNEPSVHFKIGRIFSQKENYKNAMAAFKNVIALDSEQIEAYYEIARILVSLNTADHLKEAHQTLDMAIKLNPDHEEVLKLKVKVLETQERFPETLPILKKLLGMAKHGNYKKYRLHYADMLVKSKAYEEAIAEYHALADQDTLDRPMYEARIGTLYFEQEHYARAIEFYRRVFFSEDATSKDPELKIKMAAALCNEGVRYFKTVNDPKTAVQYYKEALQYDQNNADIFYNLGKAYAELSQLDLAKEHFQKALEASPGDALSAYELGLLEDQQGDIDKAIEYYLLALSINHHHAQSAFGLGSLYGVKGDMQQAVDYLTIAIQIDPDYEDAIYNLGVALERQNKITKAIQMYKKVLSLNPNHEQARGNLMHLQHTLKK